MLNLDSMNISQIQNTIDLIKTQVGVYKTTLTTYRVAYNNAVSKIADARQMAESVKSQISVVPDQLPLPASLFNKSSISGKDSVNKAKVVSLQSLKDKAEDKITDLEEKIDTLESWQIKLEKKLEDLNKQASEYKDKAVSYIKQKAVSVGSTVVSGAQKLVTGKISKGEKKATITTETVKNNTLNKELVSKNSPLTNIS